jgi:hypothetical protein
VPVVASSPEGASAPAVVPSTPVVGVVFFGDDQVFGDVINQFGMVTMTSPTEPAALQSLLQSEFNDSGVTATNSSSGGEASSLQNELSGMDGLGQGEPARMIASGAKIAVEAHSINDFLGGESVEQYQADLITWVEDAQQAGITPVLQEPAPECDNLNPLQPEYVAAIDSVGQQLNVPVIPIYSYVQGIANWQSHMANCEIPDAYLDGLEAKLAQATIAPLVKNLIGE